MPRPTLTFPRFVVLPENRAAWLAMQDLVAHAAPPLVMLHGPPGTGKTHLVQALAAEFQHQRSDSMVAVLSAADLVRALQPTLFGGPDEPAQTALSGALEEARETDLLVVEDLQHLSLSAVEALVQVIDHLQALERFV